MRNAIYTPPEKAEKAAAPVKLEDTAPVATVVVQEEPAAKPAAKKVAASRKKKG